MVEYYVVLGDVVHSREIEDREGFQDRLEAVCGQFNATERDDVWGNFKILKGIDEFGGVLQSLENVYEVVSEFQETLRPHEVRTVVAGGSIDVGLTSWDVEKMDGEAFHSASERLEEIEDGPLSFDLLVDDDALARAVGDEINLLLHVRGDWTDRQWEVASVRERVGTQTVAAAELGVTQQAVSNVLAGANWPLVHEVEERLRETLREYEPPIEREPGDAVSWFEQVVVSAERQQYDHALANLNAALGTAVKRGGGRALVAEAVARLDDAVEPILTNAGDANQVQSVVSFLIETAERTTGPASDDLEAWALAQFARLTGTTHDRVDESGASPELRASDAYCTALGFMLAEEPAAAVQPLKRAWDLRDDLDESAVEYATSSGVALLGCADLLGPSVLDAEWDDLYEALIEQWEDTLRAPARRFLEDAEEGVEVTPEEIADAVHDDDREQFTAVEARAFASLLSMLREQAVGEA